MFEKHIWIALKKHSGQVEKQFWLSCSPEILDILCWHYLLEKLGLRSKRPLKVEKIVQLKSGLNFATKRTCIFSNDA